MSQTPHSSPTRREWLPHPLLTVVLAVSWLLLQNSFSLAHLLLGLVLGFLIPLLIADLWPRPPRIRSYSKALSYLFVVLWDIIVANVQVAQLILFRPLDRFNTRWVAVPLDLVTPEAITLFAGTITMTPGTVSADLSADGRTLLVHCLDAPDADVAVRNMKTRYEARLKEIFE